MDLKKILSVTGKSGLFKVIAENKSGFIAESLLDKKRIPVYASDKISNLEEISVYTDDKEVPLKDIFKLIHDKESGGKSIDPKGDEKKLKDYMGEVLPNYDRQRVHVSDMKKIVNWYNILHDNDMLVFDEEVKDAPEETTLVENKEAADAAPPETHKEDVPPAADNS